MSFLILGEQAPRIVPASGPPSARIAIIGEAPGAFEERQLKPFVGPAGTVLEQCMHSAGIIRSECYITNVVKTKPPGNDIEPFYNARTGIFTSAGQEWLEQLRDELNQTDANILVACGGTALTALTGLEINNRPRSVMKYRGYLLESEGLTEPRKVIPCIHPAAALRGQYIYRHLIAADLKKARMFSRERALIRPKRELITDFGCVEEALQWLLYFSEQPLVSFDIESPGGIIDCISFSSDPAVAVSIPLLDRWSDHDAVLVWRGVQRILGNPKIKKIGQNLAFDTHFLLTECGIEVNGPIEDTMIAHSIIYPELRKSLEFLGSIYCGAQAYWKRIKFDDRKDES